ncbi:hypothetical protein AV530_019648 [Patagioenas fasciata monilis]|uniref:Uncharacterized protein n=1 Tax=Patagioenas fasciata monilis TaxID=372326 RepID=A0A1V4JE43_PATFA|nr:hypothetical protein AV530_019648 [Patagioenas fasciata monilis]
MIPKGKDHLTDVTELNPRVTAEQACSERKRVSHPQWPSRPRSDQPEGGTREQVQVPPQGGHLSPRRNLKSSLQDITFPLLNSPKVHLRERLLMSDVGKSKHISHL